MIEREKYIERSPGNIINLKMFIDDLNWLRQEKWSLKQWKPRAALIDKSGNKLLYTGQKFNPKDFQLVEEGWSHDHCELCIERIDSDSEENYSDGQLWLCAECHSEFILPTSLEDIISNFRIIEK